MKRLLTFAATMAVLFAFLSCSAATTPTPTATVSSIPGLVSGLITAKGSIWVNGVEYDTSKSKVAIDGDSTGKGDGDLLVGMNVKFSAKVDPATGKALADTVDYESSAKGMVETVDTTAGTFTALGLTVQTGPLTVFEGTTDLTSLAAITPLPFIEVSGQIDPTTKFLVADRVEVKTSVELAQIKGQVSALDPTALTFTLTNEGGKTYAVTYTGTLDPSVMNGANVRVKFSGAPSGSTRAITTPAANILIRKDELAVTPGDRMELHGLLSSFVSGDPATFTVGTQSVSVTAAVLKGQILVNGSEVELQGKLDSHQVLVADKVEVQKSESELKTQMKEAGGLVKAIDLTSLAFTVSDHNTGKDLVLKVTPTTMFRGSLSGTNPMAKLIAGTDSVEVKYLIDGTTNWAVKVEVKGADGKPEGDHPKAPGTK